MAQYYLISNLMVEYMARARDDIEQQDFNDFEAEEFIPLGAPLPPRVNPYKTLQDFYKHLPQFVLEDSPAILFINDLPKKGDTDVDDIAEGLKDSEGKEITDEEKTKKANAIRLALIPLLGIYRENFVAHEAFKKLQLRLINGLDSSASQELEDFRASLKSCNENETIDFERPYHEVKAFEADRPQLYSVEEWLLESKMAMDHPMTQCLLNVYAARKRNDLIKSFFQLLNACQTEPRSDVNTKLNSTIDQLKDQAYAFLSYLLNCQRDQVDAMRLRPTNPVEAKAAREPNSKMAGFFKKYLESIPLSAYGKVVDEEFNAVKLNEIEREKYRIFPHQGLFFRMCSMGVDLKTKLSIQTVDTSFYNSQLFFGQTMKHGAIFVISPEGDIYLGKTIQSSKRKPFHHSSFLAGQRVMFSGNIVILNGQLCEFNNHSGHHRGNDNTIMRALRFFANIGALSKKPNLHAMPGVRFFSTFPYPFKLHPLNKQFLETIHKRRPAS